METHLKSEMNIAMQEQRNSVVTLNIKITTEEMEAEAWSSANRKFKKIYEEHGMYTPFMEEREKRIRAIKNS